MLSLAYASLSCRRVSSGLTLRAYVGRSHTRASVESAFYPSSRFGGFMLPLATRARTGGLLHQGPIA
jgi:hypothetical protein